MAIKRFTQAMVIVSSSAVLNCSSKVDVGTYAINEIQKNPCGEWTAISLKFRSSSYQGVFLAKDTSNVKEEDLVLQVNGFVRKIEWLKCDSLEIMSEGSLKLFNKEQYLDDGQEKYKGVRIHLDHYQW